MSAKSIAWGMFNGSCSAITSAGVCLFIKQEYPSGTHIPFLAFLVGGIAFYCGIAGIVYAYEYFRVWLRLRKILG